ncbi:glycerol-3-phosphate O-acyltransferase [Auriculariales sp. MPI-PUGE-AT-0066]|nr:glycerol-3-phosphate O-acyltransferase [Auriculariales sp. MPI-PUGE-AT-0066]
MAPSVAYDLMLLIWRIATNVFFREIRPRGSYNIPREGAVLVVGAPHHNQFLDPLLLMSEVYRESRRQVSFITAAKSMEHPLIGPFTRLMQSIPVIRPQDAAKAGAGYVLLDDRDALLLHGIGTKFTSECKPRSRISLPSSAGSLSAEITEILSDTELKVKAEFGTDSGKGSSKFRDKAAEARAAGKPGISYKIAPHIDQSAMFGAVYNKLRDGGCIGIFPEGGSHDRTDFLPFKAGVALMGLGAMAENPDLKVRIQPVGLSYFHAHKFRSRAVVEFGEPLDIPRDLVELFKQGGDKKREASSKLLDMIYEALKTVTFRAPDYDTLMVIQAARRLYKAPGEHLTLSQVVELNKRFIEGYLHFKDEPRVQQLRADVIKYNRLVRDLGLRDHQVPRAQRAGWKTLGLLVYRLGLLTVWSTFSVPGVVMNAPVFLLAKLISQKKQREALAGSSVKIAAKDVVGTWKVLISLVVVPFLYSAYAALATIIAIKSGMPMKWRIWAPFLVLSVLPAMSYAALKFGEAGMDVLKSLPPLMLSLMPGQSKQLDRVKKMREKLSEELTEVIDLYGPQLYENFEAYRMLTPSSQVRPVASSRPGYTRRKSGPGLVDGQDSPLVHPMTWIDEHLFGWSRSSKRGTSALFGASTPAVSTPGASRPATPEVSDDDGHGDYEDLLGYLSTAQEGNKKRLRSARSSYADLQQLKSPISSTALSSSVPAVSGGLRLRQPGANGDSSKTNSPDSPTFRTGTRSRKASLSDNVDVKRLEVVPPKASFEDATNELNQENRIQRDKHD